MNVSINWLNQYFDENLIGSEIEDILTKLGLEVENRERLDQSFNKVVIGKINEIKDHPDADKLKICLIDAGQEELLQIVTGAPNVYEGMFVPVALVGAKVVGGDISLSKLRGVYSYGMLCSGAELGIDNSLLSDKEKEGILPLTSEFKPGTDLKEAFALNDEVLELGLTPNRADCYGIYNVAKEIVLKKDLNIKNLDYLPGKLSESGVEIKIEKPELCHRYVARKVNNVKIEPSPSWFANLLRNVGIRPINNIVDITNYVMFELGQPMHSFDFDKIEGNKIVVDLAEEGETFVTLDGQERKLEKDMLLIKDGKKSVALAGVMGGLNSEVDEHTRNILFEAANFNNASVRRTSRKLGLRSEASGRFERGLSEEIALYAMDRAMYLVNLLGAGEVEETYNESYPLKQVVPSIETTTEKINRILGMEIPEETITDIFKKLNFKVEREGNKLIVIPEVHRIDVKNEIDLVEEVVRIFGYENIPATLPVGTTNTMKVDYKVTLVEQIKSYLTNAGMNEIVSYSFIDKASYGKCGLDIEGDKRLKVLNPLSETQSYMRESLLPGIIEIAERNYKRQRRNINIFEAGRIYRPTDNSLPEETLQLGLFMLQDESKEWYGKNKTDFYTLKGILERLVATISDKNLEFRSTSKLGALHPGRGAEILVQEEVIGYIGEVHPDVLSTYDIKHKAYYLEINLDTFKEGKVRQFTCLPKYPSIERDVAIILPKKTEYREIHEVIKEASNDKVIGFRIFDIFESEQLGPELKSVAFSITYQDSSKTMTDEEVSAIHNGIVESLSAKLGARLR